MKIIPNNFVALILTYFCFCVTYAGPGDGPPPPTIPPPGTPINSGILILLIVAVTYGLVAIKKNKLKKEGYPIR